MLIVDDDPAFQLFARDVLRSVGLSSAGARTAEEALAALRAGPPLALLVDGLLPGTRGDELVRAVRQTWAPAALPIVFVSAFFRDQAGRAQLAADGVQQVLSKPVTAEELKRALSRFPALTRASSAAPPESMDFDLVTSVELLDAFLELAGQRLGTMRRALGELAGDGVAGALETLEHEGHKLKGNGAAYGMPELSRLGAQVEQLAEALTAPVPAAARAQLVGLMDAIGARLAKAAAPAAPAPPGSAEPNEGALIVLDASTALATACAAAATAGLPVHLAADVAGVARAFGECPAAVVVVAGDQPELDVRAACARLAAEGVGPLVVMLGAEHLALRLALLEAGVAGLIHRVHDVASLAHLADRFRAQARGVPVVAVSCDAALLGAVAEVLAGEVAVVPCLDFAQLFPLLDQRRPAAVVLGPLKGLDALAAVRLIRADARHHRLPLLVVDEVASTRRARLHALAAGADEVLARPFDGEALVVKLRALKRRGRPARGALPGFPSRHQFEAALVRALGLAPRGRALAVLLCEVPAASLPGDRFACDALLAQLGAGLRAAFRASDLVAAFEGGRFAVLLDDVSHADAERLLREHLAALRTLVGVELRAGLATFPEHGADAHALLAAAAERLA